MKRVVITGASGFVGANLARRLVEDGHDVHLVLRPGHKPWRIESILADVHSHIVDLTNSDLLTREIGAIRPDWIFHLAAYGAYSSQTDVAAMIETNITGTINLVHACMSAGFEVFINTGSSSEYGFKDHAPAEDELLEPNSQYAATKAAATLFCQFTAQAETVRIPTLRLYSVYGPYEEPARLIPNLISYGLRGELPPLVSPNTARDYVYIDDVVDAYLLAANRATNEPCAIYNIGTGVQTSMRCAVETARRLLAIPAEPSWGSMPGRQWDTDVWVANNAKTKRELGWKPRTSFEDGLRKTLEWFQQHPELQRFYEATA